MVGTAPQNPERNSHLFPQRDRQDEPRGSHWVRATPIVTLGAWRPGRAVPGRHRALARRDDLACSAPDAKVRSWSPAWIDATSFPLHAQLEAEGVWDVAPSDVASMDVASLDVASLDVAEEALVEVPAEAGQALVAAVPVEWRNAKTYADA